ncbi:MAG: DMT family transporter [Oscillospiraceae bacterium]|nr:DMT family transporter [Oscillospiraceae bacterium]
MKTKTEELLTRYGFVILFAMICCLLWGSAFPCIKIGYEWCGAGGNAPSKILFAGMRFTLAGIMAVIVCSIISKKPLIPKSGKTVAHIAILSIFQTILQYLFFYIGLSNTSGVKASVIEGANVFISLIVSCCIFKMEKFTVRKLMGSIIGFAGVVLINLGGGLDAAFSLTGEGFILISTVAYAFSSVIMKRFSAEDDPMLLSGWQFIIGGLVMTAAGALTGGTVDISASKGVLMLIYLAFVSAAAYTLWAVLLKYNPVSRVSVFGFMNPVFGVILSAVLLKEYGAFSLRGAIALILVCAGIYIVNCKHDETGEHNV